MKRCIIPLLLGLLFTAQAQAVTQSYPLGTKLGWMTITVKGADHAAVRADLVQGAGERQLAQGLAHWEESSLPGQGGRVVFSGHRTTYGAWLHDLDVWPRGSVLRAYMRLPERKAHCYRLTGRKVVREANVNPAYRFRPGEVLLTFACHPKGQRTHRIIGFWWKIDCADAD